MSDISMKDVTGTPRPERDIVDACTFVTNEIVRNPMARGADGTPALIHYTVIRDALHELLVLRKALQNLPPAKPST